MEKRKVQVNSFIDKILEIKKELDNLSNHSYTISESYNTNRFSGQNKLSMDLLENLLIAVTHETASQIGFYIQDIRMLVQFIEFCEKYSEFTDEELSGILNGNLSLAGRQKLLDRFTSIEEMLGQIAIVKEDWYKMFNNKDYATVKKILHITDPS